MSKTDLKKNAGKPCPCLGDKLAEEGAPAGMNQSLTAAAAMAAPFTGQSAPPPLTSGSRLIFKAYYVQRGIGPHSNELVYASDEHWDAFHSDICLTKEGIEISDTEGRQKFGVNLRWNVEGFGAGYLTADNGGAFYELPATGKTVTLNLNFELAKSRIMRNRLRADRFVNEGWTPPRDVQAYLDLSEELFHDAEKKQREGWLCARLAQRALYYALWGGEMLELDYARFRIVQNGPRPEFLFGCDVRQYHQQNKDTYMDRFSELFNFAHLTFVPIGDEQMGHFEKREGQYNFTMRDVLFRELRKKNIQVGGRLLFWFHEWVTPDWLAGKNFDQLLKYVENRTRDVIRHYGDGMYSWEIVNELHDWANAVNLKPEQAVELTRFACEVARSEAPGIKLMINHCCPFAEYVQMKQWSGGPAKYPQRTPWQFTREVIDAGADFDIIGQQMYFPYHDLQDIIIFLERYQVFNKTVQLSEVGVTSGRTKELIHSGRYKESHEPYLWRRPWDEDLQADWLEGVYTLAYSKPWIDAATWFDFYDQKTYIDNGGLLRNQKGDRKAAFYRLQELEKRWKEI